MLTFAFHSLWLFTKLSTDKLIFQKSFQQVKKKKKSETFHSYSHSPRLLKLYSFQHKMQWVICSARTLCFSDLIALHLFTVLVVSIINMVQTCSNIRSNVWTLPRSSQSSCVSLRAELWALAANVVHFLNNWSLHGLSARLLWIHSKIYSICDWVPSLSQDHWKQGDRIYQLQTKTGWCFAKDFYDLISSNLRCPQLTVERN